MNIWRVAGVALMVGLALFLISILFKLMLVAFVTVLLVRVVGRQLAGRFYYRMGREGGREIDIISIDNPTYRSAANWGGFERVVPIS